MAAFINCKQELYIITSVLDGLWIHSCLHSVVQVVEAVMTHHIEEVQLCGLQFGSSETISAQLVSDLHISTSEGGICKCLLYYRI